MQSTPTFLEGQSRYGLLFWLRTAAWVLVAGAVSPPALAQMPADSAAGEKMEAQSAPDSATPPGAASHSEPAGPATWNKRRAAPTGVEAQLRRLAADLKLDAAQQAKIRPILVARSEEMQRLQHDTRLTPAERRQRALAIGDRSADQIRAQLTDAQRAQYIRPRTVTTVAQAGPAPKRGATATPAMSAPRKGATP